MMIDELNKKGFLNDSRFLTRKGQIYFKERKAGKVTSVVIGNAVGYTPVYVRMVLSGIRRVTEQNVRILAAIERAATEFRT